MPDEYLKHSYYTRVGLSFSRLFYINYIVFVVRSLIWCLVWMQVYWSEKSSCWKQVLEQWGSEQGSDCHVATLQRRDVSSRSAPYHLKYEWFRNQGIERRTNEGTEFQSRVTQTSRKCPGFVLSFIVWLFSDLRMVFLILNTFFFSFIMF